VYHRGDQTFVLDAAGELILTVIDKTPSSGRNVAEPKMWTGNSWVESAEDRPNSEITEYTAYWTVPSSPPSGLAINERIYLFNGIERTVGSTTYLLQPDPPINGKGRPGRHTVPTTRIIIMGPCSAPPPDIR
jgi:hypothetical protein